MSLHPSSGINESGLAAQESAGTASTPGLTRRIICSYSAQQESFAGSLRREMAIIFSASAIVG